MPALRICVRDWLQRERKLGWAAALSMLLHVAVIYGHLPLLWLSFLKAPEHNPVVLRARLDGAKAEKPKAAPEPLPAEPSRRERERKPVEPRERRVVEKPAPEPVRTAPEAPREIPVTPEAATEPVAPLAPREPDTTVDKAPEPAAPAPQEQLQAGIPEYPAEALRARIPACVLAEIYVDEYGRVERVEIAASSRPGTFDESVRKAYMENFYRPAIRDGKPVKSRILGIASFELEGLPELLCELYFHEEARTINARPYP